MSKRYIYLDPSINRIYIACYAICNESLISFVVDSAYANPHLPFSSDISQWLCPSQSLSSTSGTFASTYVLPNINSTSTLPDLTSFILPSFLSSSCPIPSIPSQIDTPLSILASIPLPIPSNPDSSSPPSTSNPMFVSAIPESSSHTVLSTNIVPVTQNAHPMITRSKHGIYKPKAM